jgi:hypothetical protein
VKLIDVNWNPTPRQLRQFGVIAGMVLPLVAWRCGAAPISVGLGALAGVAIAVLGWFAPRALKLPFLSLTILAIPIGLIIGELALALIYFGVFFPIGMVFRLMRRDRLKLTLNRQAATYWEKKPRPSGAASYYRQF